MPPRPTDPPGAPLPEVVPQPVAARLLARASELDAAYAADMPVADLRAAAVEAGISARAFEAALDEVQRADPGLVAGPVVGPRRTRRSRAWLLGAAMAVLLVGGGLAVERSQPAAESYTGAAMVDEAILLRCLSPGEAAALVRPLVPLRANAITINPTRAPRILNVHATPAQLRELHALLDRYEGAGSAACVAGPAAEAR